MNERTRRIINSGIASIYNEPVGPGWVDPVTGKNYEELEAQYFKFGLTCGGKTFWESLADLQDKTPKPAGIPDKISQPGSTDPGKPLQSPGRSRFPKDFVPPRILGLHGPIKCGKSTATAILSDYGYVEIMLAGPLKKSLATIFHVPVEAFEDQEFKASTAPIGNIPWRTYLQSFGSEGFGRELDPDYWIKLHWVKTQRALENPINAGVVVTDVRFVNEAQYILGHGGVLVELVRAGVSFGGQHVSDRRLPDHMIGITVDNNGTPQDLRARLVNGLYRHNHEQTLPRDMTEILSR